MTEILPRPPCLLLIALFMVGNVGAADTIIYTCTGKYGEPVFSTSECSDDQKRLRIQEAESFSAPWLSDIFKQQPQMEPNGIRQRYKQSQNTDHHLVGLALADCTALYLTLHTAQLVLEDMDALDLDDPILKAGLNTFLYSARDTAKLASKYTTRDVFESRFENTYRKMTDDWADSTTPGVALYDLGKRHYANCIDVKLDPERWVSEQLDH